MWKQQNQQQQQRKLAASTAGALICAKTTVEQAMQPSHLRLLILQEGSGDAAITLFDTAAEASKCTDASLRMFGDMVFGTMPMRLEETSTKIHYVRQKHQMLLSKLFVITVPTSDDVQAGATSPRPADGVSGTLRRHTDAAASADATGSAPSSPVPAGRTLGLASKAARRSDRVAALIGERVSSSAPAPDVGSVGGRSKGDTPRASCSASSAGAMPPSNSDAVSVLSACGPTRVVFAIACAFDLTANPALQQFFFAHFACLDMMLHQLITLLSPVLAGMIQSQVRQQQQQQHTSSSVSRQPRGSGAGVSTPSSLRSMPAGASSPLRGTSSQLPALCLFASLAVQQHVARFLDQIHCMYAAPRVQCPIWLHNLAVRVPGRRPVSPHRKHQMHHFTAFLSAFRAVFAAFEVPQGPRLLSAAVTSVLSTHLGWMATYGARPLAVPVPSDEDESPLAAQTRQLYGSLGYVDASTISVVVGVNDESSRLLTQSLAFLLSYFIRCRLVLEQSIECDLPVGDDDDASLVDRLSQQVSLHQRNTSIPQRVQKPQQYHDKRQQHKQQQQQQRGLRGSESPLVQHGSSHAGVGSSPSAPVRCSVRTPVQAPREHTGFSTGFATPPPPSATAMLRASSPLVPGSGNGNGSAGSSSQSSAASVTSSSPPPPRLVRAAATRSDASAARDSSAASMDESAACTSNTTNSSSNRNKADDDDDDDDASFSCIAVDLHGYRVGVPGSGACQSGERAHRFGYAMFPAASTQFQPLFPLSCVLVPPHAAAAGFDRTALLEDLRMRATTPLLARYVQHACTAVIDTSSRRCHHLRITGGGSVQTRRCEPAPWVLATMDRLQAATDARMPMDVCLELLEVRLADLHANALLVAQFVCDAVNRDPLRIVAGAEVVAALALAPLDMSLYASLAAVYDPRIELHLHL